MTAPRALGRRDPFAGFTVEPTLHGVVLLHAACGHRVTPADPTLSALLAAAVDHQCPEIVP